MRKSFVGFLVIVFLTPFIINGAGGKMNLEKEKKILLEKDREISKASTEKGILKAFYPFMTEQSLLLPETGHPVEGKETCGKLMNQVDMKGWESTLQWEPLLADISAAGDLGCTHGRFERPAGSGYYLTIWKKAPDGNWKVVFSQGLVLIKGLNRKPIDKKIDPAKADPVTRQVLAVEKAFSDYSVKHGTGEAFYRFIADNGMALSAAGPPRTKETFAEAGKKKDADAPESKLEWQALFCHAAASGDMAYNYGTYDYSVTDADGRTRVSHGYFVTVWKKQPDSGWKFLLDGGNRI